MSKVASFSDLKNQNHILVPSKTKMQKKGSHLLLSSHHLNQRRVHEKQALHNPLLPFLTADLNRAHISHFNILKDLDSKGSKVLKDLDSKGSGPQD